jgi:hypothetical protein
VFLGVYAVLAVAGNMASLLYRSVCGRSKAKLGYDVFVSHLCVSDFLMGVYLAVVGLADQIYYTNYV